MAFNRPNPTPPLPAPTTTRDLTSGLLSRQLDTAFTRATNATLRSIRRLMTSGRVAQRLADLAAEAARLSSRGLRLLPSNAHLAALLADLDPALVQARVLIAATSVDVQALGITAAGTLTRDLALPGLNDAQLGSIGIRWNRPDPQAVAQAIRYTSTDAFEASLSRYQTGIRDLVRNVAVRGMAAGQNPLATARDVRRAVEDLPAHYANSMLRTLQLTSYRDAAVVHQVANASLLEGVLRIATLDARCCMSCVALHGTLLSVGDRVDDHHQGRCVGVPIVRGRPREVQTGIDWFNAQPEARQRAQMGDAAYDAWRAGRFDLRDYSQPYRDPVFGPMIREASLKGMLGEEAKRYYR